MLSHVVYVGKYIKHGFKQEQTVKNAVGGKVAIRFSFQVEGFTHFICSSNWITNCSIWSKHTFLKEPHIKKGIIYISDVEHEV